MMHHEHARCVRERLESESDLVKKFTPSQRPSGAVVLGHDEQAHGCRGKDNDDDEKSEHARLATNRNHLSR
jgi:hypothetical protein